MPSLPRIIGFLLALALSVLPFGAAQAALPTEVNGQPLPSLSSMLSRVTPAVVNITTEGREHVPDSFLNDPFFRRFFGDSLSSDERTISGTGSGVIIHAQRGHILTNYHVIEDAEKIHVTLTDGRKFQASIIGLDPRADLAVLKIPADRLVAMRFGDSDRLQVGDFVVAIGNPYGIGQTVTSGIISALHRNPGISEYENFIQTDAPINLGNSGGPLVNLRGELIGINTAILGDQVGGNLGIGFAIPINTAAGIINQIINFGSVTRGQLGIEVSDVEPEMAHNFGLKPNEGAAVQQVLKGSAAERAGIHSGDVITLLNGQRIVGARDVKNIIGNLRLGSRIQVTLLRAGRSRNITAVISEPAQQTEETSPARPPAPQSGGDKPFWEKGL